MSERDEVRGAQNAEAEIVLGVQRGYKYRALRQFARTATHLAFPLKMNAFLRTAWLVIFCALLQACASTKAPPQFDSASTLRHQLHLQQLAHLQQFTLKGRIGVQTANKGFSGGVLWQHAATHDSIALYSPLGSQVASISKDSQRVTLEDANGNSISADSAESLTQAALGWQLPLTGLADWSVGRPSQSPVEISTWDEQGRLITLKQDGWDIEYEHYAEKDDYMLPHKILLKSEKVNLKLLVEQWHFVGKSEPIDTK